MSLSAEVFKHSGLVVEYDPTTHTIVLSEVGPWKVRDGVTVVTRQRIEVTPETEFRIVFRADDAGDEFPGQFVEAPIEAAGIYVDDWVTVECRHEANRMIALTVTVLDLPGGIYNPED